MFDLYPLLFFARKIKKFYSNYAVNHQVPNEPVEGAKLFMNCLLPDSRCKMVYIVEGIFQDGEWAILELKDPIALRSSSNINRH